ncbi:hypothetical protein F5Y14DRAFT_451031 [Nemania sp. NC0429]|nr:hypothetical protein F5Y14DRAFT_451031 [Nemania sp. NC0429]
MLSRIATVWSLLVASWFAASAQAERTAMAPVRLLPRADDYIWSITWTGPKTCTSWPCGYSYTVSAPAYTAAAGSVPSIDASCKGTVDQPLVACALPATQASAASVAISGNFSTYETSGVGNGLIDITATWIDQASGTSRTLKGVTPLQANSANHNTWTVQPEGCPLSDCAAANATRALRRGALGLQI